MDTLQNTLNLLGGIKERFNELETLLCAPEIIADSKYWLRLSAQHAALSEAADIHTQLSLLLSQNLGESEQFCALIERANKLLLHGGNECALDAHIEIIAKNAKQDADFCLDLAKMYKSFLLANGYHTQSQTDSSFTARAAYAQLKNENGLHKYSNGGATVLVLKIANTKIEEFCEKDVRTDIFNSSGPGGQNVNKVCSAVRLTHIPTNICVLSQESRSQLLNRETALKTLKARVQAHYKKELDKEFDNTKRQRLKEAQQKIRVYDYAQNIVTDLRSNVSIPLKQALSGDLANLIDSVLLKEKLCN